MQHLSTTGKPWVREITPSDLPLSAGVISVGQNKTKQNTKKAVYGGGGLLNTEDLNEPGLHVNCPVTLMIQANGVCLK